MRVQPGAQAAPQAQPPQQGPQQDPQGGPPGGQSPAAQAVKMIQDGFTLLGKLIKSAQGQLPPEDLKLFQTAAQATQQLIESLTGPAQGQQGAPPARPSPGGPMPANASQNSQPMGQ